MGLESKSEYGWKIIGDKDGIDKVEWKISFWFFRIKSQWNWIRVRIKIKKRLQGLQMQMSRLVRDIFEREINGFIRLVSRVTLVAHSPKRLMENLYKLVSFHGVWCHVDLATCLPSTLVLPPTSIGSTLTWNNLILILYFQYLFTEFDSKFLWR